MRIASRSEIENSLSPAVSLVICMKNEVNNLKENFSSWAAQVKEDDELIIIDDFSDDQTYLTAVELCKVFSIGQCLKSTFDRPGKKQAITDGIEAAKKEFVLLTDADCVPGPAWKNRMIQYAEASTDFVLGFAPFYKKSGWLNLFQRFECALTAIQYFSYANAGLPYMGVGRNMLFRRSIFDPTIYDDEFASGDDDLLVSALANKKNTAICIEPESFVYSEAPTTFKKYWHQKLRHISSSSKYKTNIKLLLGLFSSTQILTYIIMLILLLTPYWHLSLMLFLLRLLIVTLTLRFAGKVLDEEDLFKMTPLLDLCLTFYYLILALSFPFKKNTTWN